MWDEVISKNQLIQNIRRKQSPHYFH